MILLFPGQGSQKPGMAKDLAEAFPAARDVFARADAALGAPLSTLCFEGPAEELTLTHNAQPALLAHGAAVWAVVKDHVAAKVQGAAGHSLGEFSAYHTAGALSLEDALKLVRRRGELMYETGVQVPGAMAAILGEMSRTIEEICSEASARGVVVPANYNATEQIVISGEVAAVEQAMELAKAAGAKRALRLPVSGAFHSPLMQPAAAGLQQALDAARWRDPSWPIWSNVTAEAVGDAATAKSLLHQQLTSPVRWVEVVRNLAARFPGTAFVEMGPGAVLSGLVKRLAPGCTTMTCGTVAEVEALLKL
ncbi:ACP S-malonyltransferase [Pseudogemmatithrix spongiicola]|uniref:Malonyl CoA-acyl carrier protein transacylase n=1 Tax=Pseudogemmatithrix spongiicola TaxID=3062599 RepID=A0AA49JUD3_9BACT|nr:ACP S-malonyltransferase [Gemmatimonadaceae bacterium 'strain 138']WKW15111.1 ACP S-malonyltransferase [Gemmatimonadaceae bacterium 'strain 318']